MIEPKGVVPADIHDTELQLYFQPPCVFIMIPGHDGGRNLAFLVKKDIKTKAKCLIKDIPYFGE